MSTLSLIFFTSGLTLMARKAFVENDYSLAGTVVMWLGLLTY